MRKLDLATSDREPWAVHFVVMLCVGMTNISPCMMTVLV
jgi:hypothetical protein